MGHYWVFLRYFYIFIPETSVRFTMKTWSAPSAWRIRFCLRWRRVGTSSATFVWKGRNIVYPDQVGSSFIVLIREPIFARIICTRLQVSRKKLSCVSGVWKPLASKHDKIRITVSSMLPNAYLYYRYVMCIRHILLRSFNSAATLSTYISSMFQTNVEIFSIQLIHVTGQWVISQRARSVKKASLPCERQLGSE
jgi:hypothetical protein